MIQKNESALTRANHLVKENEDRSKSAAELNSPVLYLVYLFVTLPHCCDRLQGFVCCDVVTVATTRKQF